jgi:hypothetical protein
MNIEMSQQAKAIEARILDCGGRRLVSVEGPNQSALDFYTLGNKVVIVQDFAARRHGVEVYLSCTGWQMKSIRAALQVIAKEAA